MLTFRTRGKVYCGLTAVDIVRAMEVDAAEYPHTGQCCRQYLKWSLERLGHRLPPRELELSDRLNDDELALSYLCLRDEYGAGKLMIHAEVK